MMNDRSYQKRVQAEIAAHNAHLPQPAGDAPIRFAGPVDAYTYAMECYGPYLRAKMPNLCIDTYLLQQQKSLNSELRVLSLGCGTGDWELNVAQRASGAIRFTLVDLSSNLLNIASEYAVSHNIPIRVEVGDANKISIRRQHYHYIMCRSSLHHFIDLEHVMAEARVGLLPGGAFLVFGEWIGRNGLMLYPETERVAQDIFESLPPRLRLNRYTKLIDDRVPNFDHGSESFEAARSEEILPMLLKEFRPIEYVTYDAFVSLLLDFRYGPNFNMADETDRAIVAMIAKIDAHFISSGVLKPTALFGIFGPG